MRFRFNSNSNSPRPNPDPTPQLGSPNQSLSLTARLKALSRDYGWSALGVYIGLTILDFPLCFLAVRLLGTERIGHWEHVIINAFWTVVRIPFPDLGRHQRLATAAPTDSHDEPVGETEEKASKLKPVHIWHDFELMGFVAIWTELVLAYAVHKSLIFFRVPLTAALTPKVVKVLRGWGWNIGRLPKRKAAKAIKT
jgi:N-terminal acetyltransferase 2